MSYGQLLQSNELSEGYEHWTTPAMNKFKIDVDAAILNDTGKYGFVRKYDPIDHQSELDLNKS